jgi:microcystin-dependent protein
MAQIVLPDSPERGGREFNGCVPTQSILTIRINCPIKVDALEAFCKDGAWLPAMVFSVVWSLILYAYTGDSRISFGLAQLWQGQISGSLFSLELSETDTIEDLLRRAQSVWAHSDGLPLRRILEETGSPHAQPSKISSCLFQDVTQENDHWSTFATLFAQMVSEYIASLTLEERTLI